MHSSTDHIAYMLECISKGYGHLCRGLISEEEFENLIKGTDLRKKMFEELTGGYWGDMYLSLNLTPILRQKVCLAYR